jgi:RIO kinase 1
MEDYLAKLMDIAANRDNLTEKEKVDDEVFKQAYIPFTMNDVVDFERDFRRARQGESLIYTKLHGLKPDLSEPNQVPQILENEQPTTQVDEDKIPPNGENDEKEEKKAQKASQEIQTGQSSDAETEEDEGESDDDDDEEDESDEEEGEEGETKDGQVKSPKMNIHVRPRDESPNSKKVLKYIFVNSNLIAYYFLFKLRKNAIKELKREKRKEKTPKHVKKRAEKISKIKKR